VGFTLASVGEISHVAAAFFSQYQWRKLTRWKRLASQELAPQQYWEYVLSLVTGWMMRQHACTTGTMSVLRQVSDEPLILRYNCVTNTATEKCVSRCFG